VGGAAGVDGGFDGFGFGAAFDAVSHGDAGVGLGSIVWDDCATMAQIMVMMMCVL
jgi:hypothetical protein